MRVRKYELCCICLKVNIPLTIIITSEWGETKEEAIRKWERQEWTRDYKIQSIRRMNSSTMPFFRNLYCFFIKIARAMNYENYKPLQ